MRNNIILIGYRATGKSSVGRGLAAELGLGFFDMDQELELRQGQSIAEMVADRGWPYFRGLEKGLLTELASRRGLVISTGGGAILHQDVWPRIKAAGLVVWLTADQQTICRRLTCDEQTASQRPTLTGTDPYAEIAAVLREREPLYREGCHFSVDTGAITIEQVVDLIVRRQREFAATTGEETTGRKPR